MMGILDELFSSLTNPGAGNPFLQQLQQSGLNRSQEGLREFTGAKFQDELAAELRRIQSLLERDTEPAPTQTVQASPTSSGARVGGMFSGLGGTPSGSLFTQAMGGSI